MKIVVFGLGYVGATAAACLLRDGHTVIGVDLSPDKAAVSQSVRTMAELKDTRRMSDADADACVVIDRVNFAIPVTLHGDHAITAASPT